MLRAVAAMVLALALSGSAGAQTIACYAGLEPREVAELLIGRKIGGRLGVGETHGSISSTPRSARAFPTA
jgi:hypothetical protein